MAVLQDININVHGQPSEKRLQTFLRLSQNENGRMINFRVLGPPLPSGCTATFAGTKPDGTVYSTTGTVTGNFVVVQEDIQMTAVAGVWDAKLDIVNGVHNIMSALIRVTVERDVVECKGYAEAAKKESYGSPLVANVKADMTDSERVYVYTGSESGMTVGNWYYWDGSAWTSGGVYNAVAVQTDTTLSVAGKAADAKKTGDEISSLKEDLNTMNTASESDVGKALKAKTVSNGKVTEWEFGSTGSGQGLTNDQKLAILACFQHVAWTDDQGQTYYDDLYDALFPPAELTSISAVYVNSNPVYADTALDTLKQYITVTAHYSNSTTSTVTTYTLSGTLAVGTSTLTITYNGFTTTISVTVSESPKSDMDGWSDGVAYTDIDIVENSYYTGTGSIASYNSWNRTGKIPCDGASSIVFEAYATSGGQLDKTYCWFFDQNKDPLQKFDTNVPIGGGTEPVPSGAYYFGLSADATLIAAIMANGFTPYA